MDIAEFAPADPGYSNYVRAFTEILESGRLPREADFDITETIGLSGWADAKQFAEPRRFRRFRIFVTSVGLALSATNKDRGILPPNYTAIRLIDDAVEIADPALTALLIPAFQEFHDQLDQRQHEESPFLLLALLLLHFLTPSSTLDPEQLALQLMAEESRADQRRDYAFLWGCSYHDQLVDLWKRYVRTLIPARSARLKMLRCGLLEENE